VDPFPVKLPTSEVAFLSVIDYDHSKNYRFLITDKNGKAWMFDKSGNNLDGWTSKDVGSKLIGAPQHHRIFGKDYIISVNSNGVVNLFTRRGEKMKNFPLDLKTAVAGQFSLERGSGAKDTYFIVVAADGYKIKFTIDGKVISRETLLRNAVGAKFSLITEEENNGYIIVQQDSKRLSITDDTGGPLMSADGFGNDEVHISYYDFGANENYIVITDLVQKLTYLYDGKGTLLTTTPLECSKLIVRPAENQLKLFFIRDKALIIETIAR
jgi:hypothetical protein